jgi:hypothetical protein
MRLSARPASPGLRLSDLSSHVAPFEKIALPVEKTSHRATMSQSTRLTPSEAGLSLPQTLIAKSGLRVRVEGLGGQYVDRGLRLLERSSIPYYVLLIYPRSGPDRHIYGVPVSQRRSAIRSRLEHAQKPSLVPLDSSSTSRDMFISCHHACVSSEALPLCSSHGLGLKM